MKLFILLFIFTKLCFAYDFIVKVSKDNLTKLQSESFITEVTPFLNFGFKEFENKYKINILGSKIKAKAILEKSDYISEVELIIGAKAQSIFPATGTKVLNNDPLSIYQWGIRNQKQVIYKDKDRYTTKPIVGVIGQDIGLPNNEQINSANKEIVVAILDSGIDPKHVELKRSFYLNKKECENSDPNVDADGNSLAGDCLGWNFTKGISNPEAKILKDETGHGTHIAGIIAAQSNNDIGISGLGVKTKILPLKVLTEGKKRAMTDILSEATLYAIRRGVDVINFSLGWSRSLDSKTLFGAIQLAIDKGITVVAAAGNNSSNDSIFPCSYDRVICVGAISNDGSYTGFTNYGGNVDILAPGENILSTFPQTLVPALFPVFGFDVKSGTSQATPFITASVAFLKSTYPNIKNDEIISRLSLSSQAAPVNDPFNKFTNFGLVNLSRATALTPQSHIMPNLKRLKQIIYNPKNNKFKAIIPIKNYWLDASDIKVKITHNKQHIKFVKSEFIIESLSQGQTIPITLLGDILDTRDESLLNLKIEISLNATTKAYRHEVPVMRQILGTGTISKKVVFVDKPKPLAIIKDNQIRPLLQTIEDKYQLNEFPHYYLTKEEENKSLSIFFFKQNNDNVYEQKKSLNLENIDRLISINTLDLNYDGSPDYLIEATQTINDKYTFVFYYLDQNLNPLFKGIDQFHFIPTYALHNLGNLQFSKYAHKEIGTIAIPTFSTLGRTPLENQDSDSFWDPIDYTKKHHIYFLKPSLENTTASFQEAIIDTKQNRKSYLSETPVNSGFSYEYIQLVQSQENYINGTTEFIAKKSIGHSEENYFLQFTGERLQTSKLINNNNEYLDGRTHNPVTELSGNKIRYNASNIFSAFYSVTELELLFFNKAKDTLEESIVYKQPVSNDQIVGYLSSFKKNDTYTTFYHTAKNIMAINSSKDGIKVSKRPILTFSFIGNVFNELYFPIATQNDNELMPALYVDGTDITVNRIHLLEASDKGIISPIKFSMILPSACKALNPVKYSNNSVSAYSFLCINNKEQWELLYHPLK